MDSLGYVVVGHERTASADNSKGQLEIGVGLLVNVGRIVDGEGRFDDGRRESRNGRDTRRREAKRLIALDPFFLPSSTRAFRSNFFGQPLRYNQNSNADAKEGGVRKTWELTKEHEGSSGGKKDIDKVEE